MAIYKKLSLSAGGGIVSVLQQAEQVKNAATLLIGLGGTGVDCLRTIKTQVRARLKPDDPNAAAPAYSHIRFLGVDSDETERRKRQQMNTEDERADKGNARLSLDDTEFFFIGGTDVKAAFAKPTAMQHRPELAWLEWDKIPAPDLSNAGAGGVRQVGRYLMMDKSAAFMSRVQQEINSARMGLQSPPLYIHIFSGLAGGTGSGSFLDVCYMVRDVVKNIPNTTIFGYFFLPDVNLSRIPFSDNKTRAYIPRNGYAAMQELDYCMQLQYNGGGFVQEYQNHHMVAWKGAPVDMCNLICATNAAGDVIPNAYDYAMNVTAEYVMDFLTFSPNSSFGVTSYLSNFRAMVAVANGQKTIGAYVAYCVLGASCASLPLREINTYLASHLFERFSQIGGQTPTQADVEQLAVSAMAPGARGVGDIYNSLLRELSNGAGPDYAPYPDDWAYVRDYGNAQMIQHYTNQTAAKCNRLITNAKGLTTQTNEKSLLGRLRTQLEDILRDIGRGPIFGYRTISAAEKYNLLNMIDGLLKENAARMSQEAVQTDLRMRDYENAKAKFENAKGIFANNKANFRDYEFYLGLLEQHKLSMEIYQQMETMLKTFRQQVEEAAGSYYVKLARVMNNLLETFRENRATLDREEVLGSEGSFARPMMTIRELRKALDEQVAAMNVPSMMSSFMGMLLSSEEQWLTEEENKIARLVTDFFVNTAFGDFASRTITAFLEDKYGTKDVGQLSKRVLEDWIKPLTQSARPLFYFDSSIWREDQAGKLAHVSIPTASAPVLAAANDMYQIDNTWAVNDCSLTDRIYVMCCAAALPLSAYSNCSAYESAFFTSSEPGRHYYGTKRIPDMKFSNWNELPSLTPQCMLQLDRAPMTMQDIISASRSLFAEVKDNELVDLKGRILQPAPASVTRLQDAIEACRRMTEQLARPEDAVKAETCLAELRAAKTLQMTYTDIELQDDGYAAEEEGKWRLLEDHFVYAPAFHPEVRGILNQKKQLVEDARRAEEELTEKIRKIGKGTQDLQGYCDALFTGIISVEGRVLVYHKSDMGIMTDTVLSKRGPEFPMSAIPYFQGFLSYQAMDGEMREEMKQKVDARYNAADETPIRQAGAQLKEELSDDRINAWAQLASTYENRSEIVDFLRNLKQRFHIFCLENGI